MTYQIRVAEQDWETVRTGMSSYEDDIRAGNVTPGVYTLVSLDGSSEVIVVPDPEESSS